MRGGKTLFAAVEPQDSAAMTSEELAALAPEYPRWMVDRQSSGRVPGPHKAG
jgi:hypothetical protein